jgi:hypothetical protein
MKKKTGKKSKKNIPKRIYITWVNVVESLLIGSVVFSIVF